MSALGADGPCARKRASRGWRGKAWLLAAALALGAGACDKPLTFIIPGSGTGGVTGVNTGGSGGIGTTGSGGGIANGGTTGSGGTSTGGITGSGGGTGGAIDAGADQRPDVPADVPRDVQPDVRDVGPDIRDTGPDLAPIVCSASNTNCRLPGLVCLTSENRCVECVSNANCTASGKVCETVSHRCVECNTANDCPPVPGGEIKPSLCSANHHCLNGCDDSSAPVPTCPAKPLPFQCVGLGQSQDLCIYCQSNTDCPSGQTCTPDFTCVQCLGNTNCSGKTPFCDLVFTGRCVECTDSRNCPVGTLCDPVLLTCVTPP